MRPFAGYRDHRIDNKDRVVIPSAIADAIRSESEGRLYLVPHGTDPCVEAYPASIYDRVSQAHAPDRFAGDGLAHRLFFHFAEEVELKGPGRITLPKRFLPLFPKGMVRVCGMNSYLELWDPDTWDKHVGSKLHLRTSPGAGRHGS
jgi:DNA-binding transcriptional regulator/RsmH inhibitor MraZ